MGRIKSENFSLPQNAFVRFNHCLANPARLAILEYLLSRKSSTLSDVLQAINLGNDALRKHLKELVETGFARYDIVRGIPLFKANYLTFEKWLRMVNQMHRSFLELEAGHPAQPFSIDNIDPEDIEDELEEIRWEKE